MNSSSQTNNLKDILQNKIDDLEKQVLSRVNSLEEGKLSPRNESEERGKIESTLTSLHQRISDLEKGTGGCPPPPARGTPGPAPGAPPPLGTGHCRAMRSRSRGRICRARPVAHHGSGPSPRAGLFPWQGLELADR